MNVGDRVGSWEIVRPIGSGGMGKVLLGRRNGEQGAVKVLRGDPEPDEEERFEREKEALSTLRHPAIVRLLDAGEHAEGPFMVMEYAAGENLEDRLMRGEPIAPRVALKMFAALADGLRHAHDHGIQHRDVKAENVVVRSDGWASLVDFGVALKRGASRLTNAGFVMGTFAYLPPEVVEGGERDPALSDIYALGQLLYEALTGTMAYRGDPAEKNPRKKWASLIADKSNAGPLDPGPAFSDDVRAVIRRATHSEPEERYRSAGDLADALRLLLTPEEDTELEARLGASWGGAPPHELQAPAPASRSVPQRGRAGVLLVVAVLVLGCVGASALVVVLGAAVALWITL